MNKRVLSALIGLVGAVLNNGKTEATDGIIRMSLLSGADESWVEKIHQEKFRIAPNCAGCPTPCGNTSDYPIEDMDGWTDEKKALKEQVMDEILRIVENGHADAELPEIVLKGIAYIGYDLEEESYRRLLEEIQLYKL